MCTTAIRNCNARPVGNNTFAHLARRRRFQFMFEGFIEIIYHLANVADENAVVFDAGLQVLYQIMRLSDTPLCFLDKPLSFRIFHNVWQPTINNNLFSSVNCQG